MAVCITYKWKAHARLKVQYQQGALMMGVKEKCIVKGNKVHLVVEVGDDLFLNQTATITWNVSQQAGALLKPPLVIAAIAVQC